MTNPQYAQDDGMGGRCYVIPPRKLPDCPLGTRQPSVTTVLSEGLAAPGLKPWGERMVAEWSYDHQAEWSGLSRTQAVNLMKEAPNRHLAGAGDRGTAIHQAAESVLGGTTLSDENNETYGPQRDAVQSFLADYNVTPLLWEQTIVNTQVGYAGAFDLLCEIDGRITIVDWKSSKRVHGSMALQLSAYARAPFVMVNGEAQQMPYVETAGVVHLLPDGGYGWHPVTVPLDDLFTIFQAVCRAATFRRNEHRVIARGHVPPALIINPKENSNE